MGGWGGYGGTESPRIALRDRRAGLGAVKGRRKERTGSGFREGTRTVMDSSCGSAALQIAACTLKAGRAGGWSGPQQSTSELVQEKSRCLLTRQEPSSVSFRYFFTDGVRRGFGPRLPTP